MFPRIMLTTIIAAAAVAASADKVVLGKLGQVLSSCKIYTKPSQSASAYAKLSQYSYVVVKPSKFDEWKLVLLKNKKYGYIPSDTVAMLPYEVAAGGEATSRGGSTSASRFGSSVRTSSGNSNAFAAQYGLKFIGTPYVWGGTDVNNGIDCSAFVQKMFGTIGEHLPRTAAEQVNVGAKVGRLQDLVAGDRLYFWDRKRGKVGHTGIYLGNGYFVHSSSNHKGVATDYLGTKYWLGMLVAARRS